MSPRRKSRPTEWKGFYSTSVVNGVTTIIPWSELEAYTQPTIIRLVGSYVLRLGDGLTGGGSNPPEAEAATVAMGLMCTTSAGAVPSISDDGLEHPWMWTHLDYVSSGLGRQAISDGAGGASFTLFKPTWGGHFRHEFDVRVARRIARDCGVFFRMQVDTHTGSNHTPDMSLMIRALVKE